MSIEANILDSNTTFNVNDIQELYNNAIWEMSQDIEINGSYDIDKGSPEFQTAVGCKILKEVQFSKNSSVQSFDYKNLSYGDQKGHLLQLLGILMTETDIYKKQKIRDHIIGKLILNAIYYNADEIVQEVKHKFHLDNPSAYGDDKRDREYMAYQAGLPQSML